MMTTSKWVPAAAAAYAMLFHASTPAEAQQRFDLMPLLNITENPVAGRAGHYVGGYTRFHLTPVTSISDTETRDYNVEDRNIFRRWLIGRTISRVASIRVILSQPEITTTTSVAAASHESNRSRGQSWGSELLGRRIVTKYFRVDAATTATIEANIEASSSIQSDVTGNIVDVLARATRLLTPKSSLITSLTAPRIAAASAFVDQSISTLFAQSLRERGSSEFRPDDWSSKIATVEARFPSGDSLVNDQPTNLIGTWEWGAESAIVSIFSTVPLCDGEDCSPEAVQAQAVEAFKGLAPYTVMNFQIDDQQTLIQTIRSDETVARALESMTRAYATADQDMDDVAVKDAARVLCNVVSGKSESLGFNRFDTAAIIWAITYSEAFADAKAMGKDKVCSSGTLALALGLTQDATLQSVRPAAVEGQQDDPNVTDSAVVVPNTDTETRGASEGGSGSATDQSSTPDPANPT